MDTKNLKPRKKFSLSSEIANSLRIFKHQQTSKWLSIPSKALLTRINSDYLNRLLYVQGREFKELDCSLEVLIEHIRVMGPPQEHPGSRGKRLAMQPLFQYKLSQVTRFNGTIPRKMFGSSSVANGEFKNAEHRVLSEEALCVNSEKWEREYLNFRPEIVIGTILAKFLELLENHTVKSAYWNLLDFLAQDQQYSKLPVTSVYAALMHILVRGVSDQTAIKMVSSWKYSVVPQDSLLHQNMEFQNNIPSSSLFADVRSYLQMRAIAVETEMMRLRGPSLSYQRKWLQNSNIYWYAWRHAIWNKLASTIQYRMEAGYTVLPGDVNKFTMFSIFGKGLTESVDAKTEEVLMRTEEVSERIGDRMQQRATETSNSIFEKAENFVNEFFTKTKEFTEKTTQEFVSRASSLVQGLPEAISDMTSNLSAFRSALETVINQFKASCADFIKTEINFSIPNMLEALKYYILLINVDNAFLKSILFLLILNSVGCLSKIFQYVKPILSYLSSMTSQGQEARFTSSDSFDYGSIFTSAKKFACLISGAMASMISGKILSFQQFGHLIKFLSNHLRDMVWIDRGIDSLFSLIGKVKGLWSKIVEWVRQKIWGVTPERSVIAKEVTAWILQVRYFSTEAGMNAIRLSPQARSRAKALFPKGQSLLLQVSSTGEFPSREMQMDMQRCWREVKQIANYVTRLDMISQFQPTMFHIQLVGQPGIGKSRLTETLTKSMLETLYGTEFKNSFWSYNPNVEHFDGYAGQKAMLVDDMFRYNEPKHLTSLIGLITNTPVMLPMANLEDKGCQLTSELMVSSTNKAYPIAKDVFCMEAVFRRRHMLVNVEMDPRVRSPQSGAFDITLFKEFYPGKNPDEFPHLTFSLLRPVPDRPDQDNFESDSSEQAQRFLRMLRDLEIANGQIHSPTSEPLPTSVLYGSARDVPDGIEYPCEGWTFHQFLLNCLARCRAFKSMEKNLSPGDKIAQAVESLDNLDMVLNQQFHTQQGDELPKVRLIQDHFDLLMGCKDLDVDQIVQLCEAAEMTTAAPDIDNLSNSISTQDLLSSIIGEADFSFIQDDESSDDQNIEAFFTSDEDNRRERILRSRNRVIRPAFSPVEDALKLENIDGVPSIKIIPGPTIWDDYDINVDTELWGSWCVANRIWLDNIDSITYSTPQANLGWLLNVRESLISSFMTLPHSPAIPEHLRGKATKLPLWFLLHTKEINGQFYFQPPHQIYEPNPHFEDASVRWRGQRFRVPRDDALVWSANQIFRTFMIEFDQYGFQAQKEIIKYARWRNQYTGFYTADGLLEFYKDSLVRYPIYAYKYITHPLYVFFSIEPVIISWICSVAILVGTIYLIRQIASLVKPKPPQFTSKYMHRGPNSNIKYKARFTSMEGTTDNTKQTIYSMFRRNVREITFIDPNDKTRESKAQALFSGQYMIFNRHVLRNFPTDRTRLLVSMMSPYMNEPWEFWVRRDCIVEDRDGDLAVAFCENFPSARQIKHHFLTDEAYRALEAPRELVFLTSGERTIGTSHHQFLRKAQKLSLEGIDMHDYVVALGDTVTGRSGSPVIIPRPVNGDVAILGIQAWSLGSFWDSQIAIQVVTLEKFDFLVSEIHKNSGISPIQRLEDFEDEVVAPPLLAAFTSQESNNVICESPYSSVGLVGKTQFRKTPIAPFMDNDLMSSERVPAVLHAGDPNLANKKIHPLEHSLSKYFRGKIEPFDPETLDYVENAVGTWLENRLDTNCFRQLEFEEIITGTRLDGSNPMNLKTSPGIPYIFADRTEKGKKEWLSIDEEGYLDYVSDEIRDDYEQFRSLLFQGKLPLTVSYDFPKDELRPAKKAYGSIEEDIPPKTRTVTCMNMMYVMLWRELTLDMWSSFHRTADGTFPFCPGINPEGPEWSNAYHYLNQNPNAVDFDVSNWDGFLSPEIAFLVGRIISRLCKYERDSPQDLAIRAILHEVMFGYIQHNKVIYQKFRGVISGFPGTAELNTLSHLILIIYIYLQITKGSNLCSFQAFLNNTSLVVYGDDILITISDELFPLFNGETIADKYQQIGYPVTSATKDQPIVRGRKLLECSFLKSTWARLEGEIWIRKMDLNVAMDLLYWNRSKQQPLEQFYSNAVDALRILFGHGRSVYNERVKKLNSWLAKASLPSIEITYDDLYHDHMHRYYVDYY